MRVEIDPASGFCFGVVRAISEAERSLEGGGQVCCLGDIVHNRIEVQRLEKLGLSTISLSQMAECGGKRVLIRAHGEPPATYKLAAEVGAEVIDATCPVVAKLQQRVKLAHEQMAPIAGQVVLLGKRGHAEVVGLTGQVADDVIVVERESDLAAVDFGRPIYFLSQTTQSIALFEQLAKEMKDRMLDPAQLTVHDTICRQVSSREEHLREFSAKFDVVIFVCGRKSSNGRVLYQVCREANSQTFNIEEESELRAEWFEGAQSVGICGATSTPGWLMERVAARVEKI